MRLILFRCASSSKLILRVGALECRLLSSHVARVKSQNASSVTSYLIQTFGFSNEYASRVANTFSVKSLDNPNAVVALFKEHGFSDAQISTLIRKRPQILNSDPALLKAKIDFLNSKIEEPSEVARVVSSYSSILTSSLNNRLIPSFNFLSTIFKSAREAALSVRRDGDALLIDPESSVGRNLKIVVEWGVPRTNVVKLFRHNCRALKHNSSVFEETMEDLRKMGFNPKTSLFVIALMIKMILGKQKWDEKVKLYKKYGLSEEQFMSAFKKNPYIASISDEKIRSTIKFLVKEMEIEPSAVATYPRVLGMSFERRIIPRGCVVKAMIMKGLLKKVGHLYTVFCVSEDKFIKTFILPFDESHGLAKLYEKKMKLACKTSKP